MLLGEGVLVPDGELSTCLSQVPGLKPIIDHSVVENWAEILLHSASLLPACLPVIREDVTGNRRKFSWGEIGATRQPLMADKTLL